jgi:hypothetical protein
MPPRFGAVAPSIKKKKKKVILAARSMVSPCIVHAFPLTLQKEKPVIALVLSGVQGHRVTIPVPKLSPPTSWIFYYFNS